MKKEADLIEKAGGIIVRTTNDVVEVYLVHRPRYDDWSVPKGHIDSGEQPVAAALREVAEEAGFHCSVERVLPPYFYTLPGGEQSVVHFFESVPSLFLFILKLKSNYFPNLPPS